MQHLRKVVAAVCVFVTGSSHLSAQGFDGVIQFVSYENHADHPDTMTQITKGSKIRFEGMGKSGGAMIMDGNTRLMLVPTQKMYMEMPATLGAHGAAEEGAKHHGVAEKTGKTEVVAGVRCNVWHYKETKSDGSAHEGEACIARGTGFMINRLTGGMAGNYFNAGGAAFAAEMKNGGGIMKVTENGKVALIAVKIEATSVPDAMFLPPEGYTKMGARGMRGPH